MIKLILSSFADSTLVTWWTSFEPWAKIHFPDFSYETLTISLSVSVFSTMSWIASCLGRQISSKVPPLSFESYMYVMKFSCQEIFVPINSNNNLHVSYVGEQGNGNIIDRIKMPLINRSVIANWSNIYLCIEQIKMRQNWFPNNQLKMIENRIAHHQIFGELDKHKVYGLAVPWQNVQLLLWKMVKYAKFHGRIRNDHLTSRLLLIYWGFFSLPVLLHRTKTEMGPRIQMNNLWSINIILRVSKFCN